MHEKVTVVIRIDAETEEWELAGIYIPEHADNAIKHYEEADGDRYCYAKLTAPVLSFPEWAIGQAA